MLTHYASVNYTEPLDSPVLAHLVAEIGGVIFP